MSFTCPHCSADIPDSSIDRKREIATCTVCARVFDLRAQDIPRVEQATTPSAARLRAPVALPPNMEIQADVASLGEYRARESSGSITITRRWLRAKHYVLLAVLLAMCGGVVFGWRQYGASVLLGLATLFVLSWSHILLSMFLNRTVIRAGGERIVVTHGPIPTILYRNKSIAAADVKQLYASPFGAAFEVKAQLADGTVQEIVRPLVTAEQALFVEQQLERVLGLVDFEVPGELGANYPSAVAGTKAGRGAAVLTGLIPLLIGGVVVFFIYVSSSKLEGSLAASGELGSWVIEPDDCSSGQRAGFFGVELSSSADPSHRIRLTRDPVRGNLAIIEDPSQSRPTVLDIDACRRLDLTINQTNTSINDVWVMQGSATLDCDLLSGTVTFDGCH